MCKYSGVVVLSLVTLISCNRASREQHGPQDLDHLPTYELTEVRRIGSVDDPDYGFSSVGTVTYVDSILYVFEAREKQIRLYSADGRLVGRIGRRGAGPGEFQGDMFDLGVGGDTLWVYDWSTRRLSIFDRQGAFIAASRLADVVVGREATGIQVHAGPAYRDASGLFIGVSNPASPYELFQVPGDTVRLPHIRFSGDGTVWDTAGWFSVGVTRRDPRIVDVGQSKYIVPSAPSDAEIVYPTRDGRLHVSRPASSTPSTASLSVSRLGFAGDTILARSFRYTPQPFPESQLDSVARRAARGVGPIGTYMADGSPVVVRRHAEDSARARAVIRRNLRFPAYQPPVQAARVGSDGSIWLRREASDSPGQTWLVLDSVGLAIGNVQLPASNFRAVWVSVDESWAVERDSLDVPWLVHYRIRRVTR